MGQVKADGDRIKVKRTASQHRFSVRCFKCHLWEAQCQSSENRAALMTSDLMPQHSLCEREIPVCSLSVFLKQCDRTGETKAQNLYTLENEIISIKYDQRKRVAQCQESY